MAQFKDKVLVLFGRTGNIVSGIVKTFKKADTVVCIASQVLNENGVEVSSRRE